MGLEDFLNRQLHLNPGKLIRRFILAAVILFTIFMLLASMFFINSSIRNLQQYFKQIHMNTVAMVDSLVSENEFKLQTLVALPQFRDKLEQELVIYREHLHGERQESYTDNFGRISVPGLSPEPEENSVFMGGGPMMLEFISLQGIVIYSDKPSTRYKPFPYLNRLLEQAADGMKAGFFVVPGLAGNSPEPDSGVKIYFYNEVRQENGRLIGYLLSEMRTDFLFSNVPGWSPEQEGFLNRRTKPAGIYSAYMDVEKFLINREGYPLSFLNSSDEYSRLLRQAGCYQDCGRQPLSNPAMKDFRQGETNLELVRKLINEKPVEYFMLRKVYLNYSNQRVFGSAVWIEQLDLGMVVEMKWSAALKPYAPAFGLIFIILLMSFIVFSFLVYWINKLRIQARDSNPLTHLPGNGIINQRIQKVLDHDMAAAVIYGDLDNFKAYNDTYGFSKGDMVIQFTADVINSVISSYDRRISFCGHIGGDDFIYIVPENLVTEAASEIGRRFDEGVRQFYKKEHLDAGCIESENREGKMNRFPVMSFSMAGVIPGGKTMNHYLEVANRCGELKKLSKKKQGSTLVLDRRK